MAVSVISEETKTISERSGSHRRQKKTAQQFNSLITNSRQFQFHTKTILDIESRRKSRMSQRPVAASARPLSFRNSAQLNKTTAVSGQCQF